MCCFHGIFVKMVTGYFRNFHTLKYVEEYLRNDTKQALVRPILPTKYQLVSLTMPLVKKPH